MQKMIYLGILFALTILVVAFARTISKKHDKVSKTIFTLFAVAVVAIIANGIFVMSHEKTIATAFHSVFLSCIDWVLLYMIRYVYYYTEHEEKQEKWMVLCYVVAAVETVSMILNPIFHHVFVLQEAYSKSYGTYFYPTGYTPVFYIHLVYCYVLVLGIGVLLIHKVRHTARLYRKKYMAILLSFIATIVFDAIGLAWKPPIDISLIFYCALALFICFFTEFYVPQAMIDQILSRAVQIAEMGVGCVDISGKCIYVNRRGKDMFYRYKHISLDKELSVAEQYFDGWLKRHWQDGCSEQVYMEHFEADDRTFNYEFTVQRLTDEENNFLGYFVTCIDRTEETEKYREEHYRATHDMLTGIYNEQCFEEHVIETLRTAGKPYVMITSDIKDFKLVNDMLGTKCGDEILKLHAHYLRERAKEDEVYGRLSEDQFAFCMPKERYTEEVFIDVMDRVISSFENEYFRLQLYMGVYEITDVTEPVYMMIDKCNLAINTIKGDYTKRVAYFDDALLHKEVEKNMIINEFEQALDLGQIQIYLQAQTKADGTVTGAEALARWIHPTKGLIAPNEFIPTLEATGLIYKLDLFVWELAAQQLALWHEKGRDDLYLSVNISVQDQYYLDVYEVFTGLVEKYHIDPRMLKLEITETLFVSELENHKNMLERLQSYGFEVEIDDFGSGYSSLNILKDIKADVIKIDMGFLQETKNVDRSQSILRSLIRLVKQLHMEVITEGVETEQQVQELLEMGCECFQGFYFCRPIPLEEFEEKYHI